MIKRLLSIFLSIIALTFSSCNHTSSFHSAKKFDKLIQQQVEQGEASLCLEKRWDNRHFLKLYKIDNTKRDIDGAEQCGRFYTSSLNFMYGGDYHELILWIMGNLQTVDAYFVHPPLDHPNDTSHVVVEQSAYMTTPFYYIHLNCDESQKEEARQMVLDFLGYSHKVEQEPIMQYKLSVSDPNKLKPYRTNWNPLSATETARSGRSISMRNATLRGIASTLQNFTAEHFTADKSSQRYSIKLEIVGKPVSEIATLLEQKYGITTDSSTVMNDMHFFIKKMKRCSDIQTSRHSESDNLEISPSENLSDIKEQQQPKTETTGIVSAISEQEFLELDKKGVVVLEFYTTWCGPCRKQTTIMGRLAKDNPQVRFFKIDAEQAPQLDTQFRIDAVPVIIVFKDGQVTALLKGLQSKKVIEEKLMKLME